MVLHALSDKIVTRVLRGLLLGSQAEAFAIVLRLIADMRVLLGGSSCCVCSTMQLLCMYCGRKHKHM
jgi:hypothetical protein